MNAMYIIQNFGHDGKLCIFPNKIEFLPVEQAAADVVGRTHFPDGEGRHQDLPQAARLRTAGPEEDHGLQRDALVYSQRGRRSLHSDKPEWFKAPMNCITDA